MQSRFKGRHSTRWLWEQQCLYILPYRTSSAHQQWLSNVHPISSSWPKDNKGRTASHYPHLELSLGTTIIWVSFKSCPSNDLLTYILLGVLLGCFTNITAGLSADRSDPFQKISPFIHQVVLSNCQYSVLSPFPACKTLMNTLSDWPSHGVLEIPDFLGHFS